MSNGVCYIKTAQAVWKKKHIAIWEAANGPVPQGHVVIFADGNKSNFDLDNLLLVSRQEFMIMNHLKLIFPDKEATKAGKLVADLILLINRKKREAAQVGAAKRKKENTA
ncbi:MAG: HNH endonuclease [Spirochaetaceae bacterium]|nr:HNH endonuclease [Spirochaetaceae bacterium]